MGNPGIEIVRFGSMTSGFATRDADADIVLLSNSSSINDTILSYLCEQLKNNTEASDYSMRYIPARIPIIIVEAKRLSIEIDVSCNHRDALLTTELIKTYGKIDERVRDLGILLKLWKSSRNIDYVFSYALLLMMISYMQNTDIPLLPSLQQLSQHPTFIQENFYVKNRPIPLNYRLRSDFERDIEVARKYSNFSKINPNLFELLQGFFEFYNNQSRIKNEVVSVRLGKLVSKQDKQINLKIIQEGLSIECAIETSRDLSINKKRFPKGDEHFTAEVIRAGKILQNAQSFAELDLLFEKRVRTKD